MKNFKNIVRMFAATALLTGTLMSADAQDREHRAIWMSPYLGSNWPTSAITEGTAASHKNILCKALDKLKRQNINVLYYHVRSCCDANYKSSYEPWSDAVSSARGVAPAFDPFEYIIEQAHLFEFSTCSIVWQDSTTTRTWYVSCAILVINSFLVIMTNVLNG